MLNKKRKVKALLLDFDGTLIDSVPALFSAYSNFLNYHEKRPSLEEFTTMNGFTVTEMIACVKSWHKIEESPEELLEQYKAFVKEAYMNARFFKGSFAFLKWAHEKGIKIALVTASKREWVGPLLEHEDLSNYFTALITYDEIKKGKPSPEGYNLAVETLKISPEESIAVEDSIHGIEAAINANLDVIQFRSQAHFVPPDERAIFSGSWPDIQAYLQEICD